MLVTVPYIPPAPRQPAPPIVEGCKYQVKWGIDNGAYSYKCLNESEYQQFQAQKAAETLKAQQNLNNSIVDVWSFIKRYWWVWATIAIVIMVLHAWLSYL